MDLSELRLIVSRHLPIAFVVFAVCVAAGFAAAFLPAESYRTSATIVIDVNNDPEVGAASVQQASFLLPAIEERAKSPSLRGRVANDVPPEFRQVRVDIETISNASVLRIRGTSESAEAAQVWVNAISDRLVEEQTADSPLVLGVLDQAPLKPRPVSPNTEPIMAAFIVMGVILALFSTLAADRIKRAFDTTQTVRDRLGTTVLAELPALRRRTERRQPIVSLLDGPHPSSELVAAFETLRTNVEFRMAQVNTTRVAVVSFRQDSGNSVVTAGLSYMMASVGHHVVAIDADLRRPMLADQLNLRPGSGLGDVGSLGVDGLRLEATDHPRLELLPAGFPTGRPSEIISANLPEMLDRLDDGSRRLFIDSSPLLGAPESAVIIAEARYVVLTVNNSSSDFSHLSEAIDLVNDAGGVLLGVVINRASRRRVRSQGYHQARPEGRRDHVAEFDSTESAQASSTAAPTPEPASSGRRQRGTRPER